MTRATGEAAARATAYHHAYLKPTAPMFISCGLAGCKEIAPYVLVAGGAEQFYCCAVCGAAAIEADRKKPGVGWKGAST